MHSACSRCTFLRFFKFPQIKEKGPDIFGETNSTERLNYLVPFCISILRVLRTQIFRYSLDFRAFCMIQEYFSQTSQLSANERGGT